jgi:hypothetical protein
MENNLRDYCETNNINGVLSLVKKVDINYDNGVFLRRSCLLGNYKIVKILLENGADPDVYVGCCLRIAMEKKHFLIVKLLIDNNIEIHDHNIYSLSLACKYGKYYLVKSILEHNGNPCSRNYESVIVSYKYGEFDILKLLSLKINEIGKLDCCFDTLYTHYHLLHLSEEYQEIKNKIMIIIENGYDNVEKVKEKEKKGNKIIICI